WAMPEHWETREVPTRLAFVLLALAAALAFANAWPDALVYDDKFFAAMRFQLGPGDIQRYFTTDLWAASGLESGLYRPLLLVSLALESRLYGDWLPGYHLDNIALHVAATLLVYGLLRKVLRMAAEPGAPSDFYALLAALLFAVHPIHTEVVNSIFNRSELLVALASAGGLWWLLHFLYLRPGRAWLGLALAYLFGLFARESAVVLPALAVALVLLLARGTWPSRIRQCLPALWLLLPLILYLALRAIAFSAAGPENQAGADEAASISSVLGKTEPPRFAFLLDMAGVWGRSLWLMVWPHPLLLVRPDLPMLQDCAWLLAQLALGVTAILRFRAGRPALLLGLAFFYIALLPSSRFFGITGGGLHVAERYLYTPSIGPAIALSFGLRHLGRRLGPGTASVPLLLALLVALPLTWNRNSEWSSDVRLFESEYRRGHRGTDALRLLSGALLGAGKLERAAALCDTVSLDQLHLSRFANNCGIAYSALGRIADAEAAFVRATDGKSPAPVMLANLAQFYLRQGRRA
ncbi:MAG TPA: hypothetical protein VF861_06940, partial [Telluria sp.]